MNLLAKMKLIIPIFAISVAYWLKKDIYETSSWIRLAERRIDMKKNCLLYFLYL